jgi:hypothetical protein
MNIKEHIGIGNKKSKNLGEKYFFISPRPQGTTILHNAVQ